MVDEVTGNYSWLTEGVAQYVEKRLTGLNLPARRPGEIHPILLRQMDKTLML